MSEESDYLWGVEDIARHIGRTKRQTYRLLETGQLDGAARKSLKQWVMSKEAFRATFSQSPATATRPQDAAH